MPSATNPKLQLAENKVSVVVLFSRNSLPRCILPMSATVVASSDDGLNRKLISQHGSSPTLVSSPNITWGIFSGGIRTLSPEEQTQPTLENFSPILAGMSCLFRLALRESLLSKLVLSHGPWQV